MPPRHYLQSLQQINYPSSALWKLISSGTNVQKWHPLVDSCTLSGTRRTCFTEQGELLETVLVNDHSTRTYRYQIHPQPVYPISSDIWCCMKVIDGSEGTLLIWDIEFNEVSAALLQEMRDGFETLCQATKNMIEAL